MTSNGRPYAPADLRGLIQQHAAENETPINQPTTWAVVMWFKNNGIGDDDRHDLLEALTGKRSAKALTMGEVKALAEWLTTEGAADYVLGEAADVLRERAVKAGQVDMFEVQR